MDVIGSLRVLWRNRPFVVLAALLGGLVGLASAYSVTFPAKLESRQYLVGLGSAHALVDTPSSQVVDLGGENTADIQTLAARATLLASLMTSSPIKDQIARRAGIRADQLIAIAPASSIGGAPMSSKPPPGASDPRAYVIKAGVPTLESGELPIIVVDTQAPDADVAARLADASIEVVQARVRSGAGTSNVPDARRVAVTQLGSAESATVARGPSRVLAVFAALFVFALGCAAILAMSALMSSWRGVNAMAGPPDDAQAPTVAEETGPFDQFEPSISRLEAPPLEPEHEPPAPESRQRRRLLKAKGA